VEGPPLVDAGAAEIDHATSACLRVAKTLAVLAGL
jgi:hypothetical protein